MTFFTYGWRRISWLIAGSLLWASSFSDADVRLEASSQTLIWTGPMAVLPLLDNWSGEMADGDDGFFWQQNEISATSPNGIRVSHVSRTHAEYRMSNQVSYGFYYEANDLEPDELYEANANISARHYEGEGVQLAYRWEQSATRKQAHWSVQPSVSWLKIHEMYWGHLNGYVYYQGPGDWGGDADFNYGYTDDKIGRGNMPQKTYGALWSLGLQASFEANRWRVNYQGYNLWARLHWDDSLYSDGYWSTTRSNALFQIEYYDDLILRPAPVHFLSTRWRWRDHLELTLDQALNRIRDVHELGLRWQTSWSLVLSAAAETRGEAIRLGLNHRWFDLSVLTHPRGLDEGRLVGLNARVGVSF